MSGDHVLWLKRTTWMSSLGAFLLIACNATDPASPAHDDPANSTGGSTSVGSGAAGVGASGGHGPSDAGAASGCVVARKLDECCPTFKPVFRSELESNGCLVEYG